MRLDERRASRAACLSCGLCAQLTWPSRYCGTTVSKLWAAGRGQCGEDGRSSPHWVLPKRQFGRPLVPRPAAARSGLTVHFLYVLSARGLGFGTQNCSLGFTPFTSYVQMGTY